MAVAQSSDSDKGRNAPPRPQPATNSNWPLSYTTAAAEAAAPSSAEKPQPHWSQLPIWGVEAQARGYQIPLPFGIGVNYYHEQQPFTINDLQVGIRGRAPESVTDFVQLRRVDTTLQNVTARFDAWLFPFLNFYGLAGYTWGTMKGRVGLPEIGILRIPAQTLPIALSYHGPTFGGGGTGAGGLKVSKWRDLTAFVVADANYTTTPLTFEHEKLFTDTKIKALVFSTRLGLRGKVTQCVHTAIWVGAMYQSVSETLAGQSIDGSLDFLVKQSPVGPWNTLMGGRIEVGKHLDLIVEGGIGIRSSILGGATFHF
jgi:hypothetical protein